MDNWKRMPAIEAGGPACLCCGTPTNMFPMDGWIAVGFGSAGVTKDGKEVYSEPNDIDDEDAIWTGEHAEKAAAADPDHDWRIYKYAPLYESVYQRHAEGQWVLIERGEGFA
jgi:hypothetical protein